MTSATSDPAPVQGQPGRRLRDRFVWHAASAFGVSVLQQVIGLLRQIIIAALFGLSRDFDAYVVVYGLATMVVFTLTGTFDTVIVSRLVQVREREGDAPFWRASNRVLVQAAAAGVLFAAVFLALLWLTLPVVAAGFSPAERALVGELGWYFIPWLVVIVPYYALSAHLKAAWQFSWVFGAEILTMIVSTVVIVFEHGSVTSLPLAYGAGYAASALLLLIRRGLRGADRAMPAADFTASAGKQYLSIQVGTAAGLADRYYQSFLAPGGISALGYVGLIVNNLSSLMTFREIYVVPLTAEIGREQRVERMLQGLILISIPIALFFIVYAHPIVGVLLQRGKFTPDAVALTALVLRIQALSLIISTIMVPLERILQIVDRMSFVQIRYAVAFVGTLVFQSLFVLYLRMDVAGVAWGWICNSALVLAVLIELVRRCGVVIRVRGILVNAVYASVAGGLAVALSWPLASRFDGLAELAVAGVIYGAIIAFGFLLLRKRWRTILG